jgi:hypothetical protein
VVLPALESCVPLFDPVATEPLFSAAPVLALDFCSLVVPPEASCEPLFGLDSVEDFTEPAPFVEESSGDGCLALFCISAPPPVFGSADFGFPCGHAPEASGVQSPEAPEPDGDWAVCELDWVSACPPEPDCTSVCDCVLLLLCAAAGRVASGDTLSDSAARIIVRWLFCIAILRFFDVRSGIRNPLRSCVLMIIA